MQLIEGNGKKGLLSYEFCRSVAAIGTGLSTFAASIALLDSGVSALVISGIVAVSQYAMTRQRQEESALAMNISQAALAAVVSNAVLTAITNGAPAAANPLLTKNSLPLLAQERLAQDVSAATVDSMRNGFTLSAGGANPREYKATVRRLPAPETKKAAKKSGSVPLVQQA